MLKDVLSKDGCANTLFTGAGEVANDEKEVTKIGKRMSEIWVQLEREHATVKWITGFLMHEKFAGEQEWGMEVIFGRDYVEGTGEKGLEMRQSLNISPRQDGCSGRLSSLGERPPKLTTPSLSGISMCGALGMVSWDPICDPMAPITPFPSASSWLLMQPVDPVTTAKPWRGKEPMTTIWNSTTWLPPLAPESPASMTSSHLSFTTPEYLGHYPHLPTTTTERVWRNSNTLDCSSCMCTDTPSPFAVLSAEWIPELAPSDISTSGMIVDEIVPLSDLWVGRATPESAQTWGTTFDVAKKRKRPPSRVEDAKVCLELPYLQSLGLIEVGHRMYLKG